MEKDIRLKMLQHLNKHFEGTSNLQHLDDGQMTLVLNAMEEVHQSEATFAVNFANWRDANYWKNGNGWVRADIPELRQPVLTDDDVVQVYLKILEGSDDCSKV